MIITGAAQCFEKALVLGDVEDGGINRRVNGEDKVLVLYFTYVRHFALSPSDVRSHWP